MRREVLAIIALLLVALWVAVYNSAASWVALATVEDELTQEQARSERQTLDGVARFIIDEAGE